MMDLGNGTPHSPFPSATVLMLRDAPGGLEVFLLKRHGLSEVLGGAYVFPGGKVDRRDAGLAGRLDQPPSALHEALGEPDLDPAHAVALYVAAIREAFEEAGVLFAAFGERGAPAGWQRAGRTFDEALASVREPLASASLVPWSRWVTPAASVRARKHFDARFFVATVPAGQEPVHDEHETTESVWLAPQTALRQCWEGRIELAAPQIMSLAHLSRYRDAASVLAAARSRQPPRIQPEACQQDGVHMVCYPGDALHPVQTRAMPGPSRLWWRNNRYEPDGGFEALFS